MLSIKNGPGYIYDFHGLTISPSCSACEVDATNGEIGIDGDEHLNGGDCSEKLFGEDGREVVEVLPWEHNSPTCLFRSATTSCNDGKPKVKNRHNSSCAMI